jgi:hypothetical protein
MNIEDVALMNYRRYSGGDPSADSGLELADFEQFVKAARAFKIKLDYWQSSRIEGERVINQSWLQNYYSIPVLLNESTGVYYSVLPTQVFGDLPKGKGLYFVSQMQDFTNPIMPMTIGEQWLFSSLPQDDTMYYYFDNTNIYYSRFNPEIKDVFMQFIPLISDTIPDEVVDEVCDLVMKKFLILNQNNIQEDKVDNSNPNKREVRDGN